MKREFLTSLPLTIFLTKSMGVCMYIEPKVSLVINGKQISSKVMEALIAVLQEGSQKRAANKLYISVPVLHRYIRKIEDAAGFPVLEADRSGTRLTNRGKQIIEEYVALKSRMRKPRSITVGATIITEELLLSATTRFDKDIRFDIIISDDESNVENFKAGMINLVILDDPFYIYELDDIEWDEIGEDRLVHVDRGPRYMRFRFGPQRIGFKHLETTGAKYEVVGETGHLQTLVHSPFSFFANESLLERRGFRIKSATSADLLSHKIVAMYRCKDEGVANIVTVLKSKRMCLPRFTKKGNKMAL